MLIAINTRSTTDDVSVKKAVVCVCVFVCVHHEHVGVVWEKCRRHDGARVAMSICGPIPRVPIAWKSVKNVSAVQHIT